MNVFAGESLPAAGRRFLKMERGRGRDLVFLCPFDWDVPFMSFHRELFEELASLGWNVLWIGEHLRPRAGILRWFLHAFRGRWARRGSLRSFHPWSLSVLERLWPSWRRHVISQAARSVKKLGFKNPVVMVFSPDRLETMSRIPAAATLYWTGDEVTQPGERELLEKVDLILAISPVSYAEKDHLCPGKVRRVSTGIDFERYHKVLSGEAVPVELENMKGPIVGYAGSLYASRVDLDLLLFLARKHDGMNFVLVGPLDETAKRFFRVNRVSNLHVLGAREYERMPYYIKRFDVGLIPYRLTRFNLGCNPLKLYEYFALGKPVVSMALPSVEEAGDLVRIGRNPDEFNEQLGRALEEKDDVSRRDARVRYAEEHGTKKISRDLAGWAEEAVSLRRGPAAGARK